MESPWRSRVYQQLSLWTSEYQDYNVGIVPRLHGLITALLSLFRALEFFSRACFCAHLLFRRPDLGCRRFAEVNAE